MFLDWTPIRLRSAGASPSHLYQPASAQDCWKRNDRQGADAALREAHSLRRRPDRNLVLRKAAASVTQDAGRAPSSVPTDCPLCVHTRFERSAQRSLTVALLAWYLGACTAQPDARLSPPPAPTPIRSAVQQEAFQLKQTCAELGRERAQRDEKAWAGTAWTFGERRYCFSLALNTCIYSSALVTNRGDRVILSTIDLLTDTKLLDGMAPSVPEFRYPDGRRQLSASEYYQEQSQLFENCVK